MKYRSLLLLLLFFCTRADAQQLLLKKGLKITRSVKTKGGSYRLSADSSGTPLILVEGKNITVDFNNALLEGSATGVQPNQFRGVAISIRGSNVTIRNLRARGFKVALLAKGVKGLVLENCDLSYNYREKLKSTQLAEAEEDWLSYHQNDKDEWLRYGAAIYLADCDSVRVSGCTVKGGQNALMMTRCNGGRVYNNDFSFNSGVGIALYRSSSNAFLYNRVIFNVRGYSHGIYQRGQDSAGFLVFEQSSQNLFYKNAATHSGDGFFLWAGQSTMDTGEGGSNDNILLDNDFSYAPTNGVELTFSRNRVIHNRIFECTHGIWAGYSYGSEFSRNQFRFNKVGIAIEHGQNNLIVNNIFFQDQQAIRLWGREQQPADWAYAWKKDTRSRRYLIAVNSFNRNRVAMNISRTDSVRIFDNKVSLTALDYQVDSTVTNLDTTSSEELVILLGEEKPVPIPEIRKPSNPFKGGGLWSGRKNIRMTEWGPYDFGYPMLWLSNPKDSGTLELEVLGPKGKWRIISSKGLDTIKQSGLMGEKLLLEPGVSQEIEVVAEYRGEAFRDMMGRSIPAAKPYLFRFGASRVEGEEVKWERKS